MKILQQANAQGDEQFVSTSRGWGKFQAGVLLLTTDSDCDFCDKSTVLFKKFSSY